MSLPWAGCGLVAGFEKIWDADNKWFLYSRNAGTSRKEFYVYATVIDGHISVALDDYLVTIFSSLYIATLQFWQWKPASDCTISFCHFPCLRQIV